MSLADVLNTDVGALGERLRRGFSWWLDQLGAMAAPVLAQGRGGWPAVTAERRADGAYLIRREGHADRLHPPDASRIAAALVLPPGGVLVRTLTPPPLPERDIRRMMTLDLDRLTPFPAGAVYHDIRLTAVAEPGGKPQAQLAVVPRAQAEAALADALDARIDPVSVIAIEGQTIFDFLPAMRAAGAVGPARAGAGYLWGAVALLLALNVGVAIWRDISSVERLQEAVAVQQPVVDRVQRLRREVRAASADAQARAEARAAGEPLRVLDALSRSLPDGAWVQRLSWERSAVRIVGLRRDGVDVVSALRREPLFVDARDTDAAASAANAFDVVAAVAPRTAGAAR